MIHLGEKASRFYILAEDFSEIGCGQGRVLVKIFVVSSVGTSQIPDRRWVNLGHLLAILLEQSQVFLHMRDQGGDYVRNFYGSEWPLFLRSPQDLPDYYTDQR